MPSSNGISFAMLSAKAVAVAEHARDVADHRLRGHRAVGDDLRDAVAPVALGDVIDDPVAALHAEVHVEVRHRDALRIQEPLEQQVIAQRVEIGDAERVRDQRARAGATARTHRHAVLARPADEIRHDQEVARETHLADHVELARQPGLVGSALRRSAGADDRRAQSGLEAGARLLAQMILDAAARGHRVGRQGRLAEPHLEVQPPRDLDGILERLRQVGEQLRHLLRGAQVLLLAVAARTRGVGEQRAFLDADPRLVRLEIVARHEAHVVGRDDRHAARHREPELAGDAFLVAGAPGALQLEVEPVVEQREPRLERAPGLVVAPREQRPAHVAFTSARQGDESGRRVGIEPSALQSRAVTALAFEIRPGHEPGEVEVASRVLAQQYEAARLGPLALLAHQRIDAHQRLQPARLRRTVELDEGEQVALVGHGHGRHAHARHGIHQPLADDRTVVALAVDADDTVDKRVLRMHVEVDESGHRGRAQRRSQDCTGA